MPEIHLLTQNTIDKIAAGEVVERPLSVVKELVENAIDAGAGAITVEIREGGNSLIRVTDNGCGIEKSQVKKAFLRHATSKIKSAEDLESVSSLGFRGEALSSIAAVSQVEIITKTEQELTGIRYCIAGGEEEGLEEIGAPTGTTFLVRNLFFNTPVRKKFLKTPQTEGSYVADMLEHLALSHPDRSIKFLQNGQLKFHTSGNGNLKEVIYRIYGRNMAEALIPFEAEAQGIAVSGFLGKPEVNRSNRNYEVYFVNGRFVKNDIITRAVEEGYRSYLMQHKFPFFVLHFTLSPDQIDVNVHPSKMEIRLRKGQEFYGQISDMVKSVLQSVELIPDVRLSEDVKTDQYAGAGKAPEPFETRRSSMLLEESGHYQSIPDAPQNHAQSEVSDLLQKYAGNKVLGVENTAGCRQNAGIHSNLIKADRHVLIEKPAQLNMFEEKFLTDQAKENYQILGQIFDTYWLVAFQDKLFIIDQHAAHEKVKYERFVKNLESGSAASQNLNPPVILSLTGKEVEVLNQYHRFFETMGFEIEAFGDSSFAIRSIPLDLYDCSEAEFFTEILDELTESPVKGAPDVILRRLASMACKSAVKGNHRLKKEEITALIDELLTLENPYHCPHGRPTIISMSKYEIEKKFKRIV